MDVPWAIFVGFGSVALSISFPVSVVMHERRNVLTVVGSNRVLINMGSLNMLYSVGWLEVVVAMSLDVVNDRRVMFSGSLKKTFKDSMVSVWIVAMSSMISPSMLTIVDPALTTCGGFPVEISVM